MGQGGERSGAGDEEVRGQVRGMRRTRSRLEIGNEKVRLRVRGTRGQEVR